MHDRRGHFVPDISNIVLLVAEALIDGGGKSTVPPISTMRGKGTLRAVWELPSGLQGWSMNIPIGYLSFGSVSVADNTRQLMFFRGIRT